MVLGSVYNCKSYLHNGRYFRLYGKKIAEAAHVVLSYRGMKIDYTYFQIYRMRTKKFMKICEAVSEVFYYKHCDIFYISED